MNKDKKSRLFIKNKDVINIRPFDAGPSDRERRELLEAERARRERSLIVTPMEEAQRQTAEEKFQQYLKEQESVRAAKDLELRQRRELEAAAQRAKEGGLLPVEGREAARARYVNKYMQEYADQLNKLERGSPEFNRILATIKSKVDAHSTDIEREQEELRIKMEERNRRRLSGQK